MKFYTFAVVHEAEVDVYCNHRPLCGSNIYTQHCSDEGF